MTSLSFLFFLIGEWMDGYTFLYIMQTIKLSTLHLLQSFGKVKSPSLLHL